MNSDDYFGVAMINNGGHGFSSFTEFVDRHLLKPALCVVRVNTSTGLTLPVTFN